MIDLISKLLSLNQLKQEEREGMIDLIILGMYADNNIALPENELLKQFSQSLNWEAGESLNSYINKRIAYFRDIRNDPSAVDETIQLLSSTLSNQSEEALKILKDVIEADGREVKPESELYQRVERAFQ